MREISRARIRVTSRSANNNAISRYSYRECGLMHPRVHSDAHSPPDISAIGHGWKYAHARTFTQPGSTTTQPSFFPHSYPSFHAGFFLFRPLPRSSPRIKPCRNCGSRSDSGFSFFFFSFSSLPRGGNQGEDTGAGVNYR